MTRGFGPPPRPTYHATCVVVEVLEWLHENTTEQTARDEIARVCALVGDIETVEDT